MPRVLARLRPLQTDGNTSKEPYVQYGTMPMRRVDDPPSVAREGSRSELSKPATL